VEDVAPCKFPRNVTRTAQYLKVTHINTNGLKLIDWVYLEGGAYVQVPINTFSTFAPVSEIRAAKAKVNNSTMTEADFLLISTKSSKKIGMSRMVMTVLMARTCAANEILVGENKWTSLSRAFCFSFSNLKSRFVAMNQPLYLCFDSPWVGEL
jgi:hypothetical protein